MVECERTQSRGGRLHVLGLLVCVLAASSLSAATYVLPVVVSGVAGREGSYWNSEVRVVKLSLAESVTVRRAWVALPGGGGFQDDPATAPNWELPANSLSMLVLFGRDLAAGLGVPHAAIGLEIDGDVDVYLHAVNTGGAAPLRDHYSKPACLPGPGQLLHVEDGMITGPSRATWVTAGTGSFRANLGIVNPGPTDLVIEMHLYYYTSYEAGELPVRTSGYVGEPVGEIIVPAWGWLQAENILEEWPVCGGTLEPFCWGGHYPHRWPGLPFTVSLIPQSEQPYYAYVSLVSSPANDPEFVPVLAGGLDTPDY